MEVSKSIYEGSKVHYKTKHPRGYVRHASDGKTKVGVYVEPTGSEKIYYGNGKIISAKFQNRNKLYTQLCIINSTGNLSE